MRASLMMRMESALESLLGRDVSEDEKSQLKLAMNMYATRFRRISSRR